MNSAVRYVTVEKFSEMTGYTPDAVQSKIKRGDWLEGAVWHKAPDGRRLIDLEGYDSWVTNGTQVSAQYQSRRSRSTSTTAGRAAANG